MSIDKISSVNESKHVSNAKTRATQKTQKTPVLGKDSINISNIEDRSFKELYTKALDIIHNTPGSRAEKIAEVKSRLETLKNPSDAVLEVVAQKILKDFGV